MATYYEKLQDPRWQQIRLRVFERDDFRCRKCDCNTKPLHVHHINYEPGFDPWDYDDLQLITLCETCHKEVGRIIRKIRIIIAVSKTSTEKWFDILRSLASELPISIEPSGRGIECQK
jgi:hypothetical protein